MPALARRVSPWFLVLVGVTVAGGVLAAAAVPARSEVLAVSGIFVLVLGGWTVSLWSRKPYAQHAAHQADYPMSYRYDETDSVLVCDAVKIPLDERYVKVVSPIG